MFYIESLAAWVSVTLCLALGVSIILALVVLIPRKIEEMRWERAKRRIIHVRLVD